MNQMLTPLGNALYQVGDPIALLIGIVHTEFTFLQSVPSPRFSRCSKFYSGNLDPLKLQGDVDLLVAPLWNKPGTQFAAASVAHRPETSARVRSDFKHHDAMSSSWTHDEDTLCPPRFVAMSKATYGSD